MTFVDSRASRLTLSHPSLLNTTNSSLFFPQQHLQAAPSGLIRKSSIFTIEFLTCLLIEQINNLLSNIIIPNFNYLIEINVDQTFGDSHASSLSSPVFGIANGRGADDGGPFENEKSVLFDASNQLNKSTSLISNLIRVLCH